VMDDDDEGDEVMCERGESFVILCVLQLIS